jgi:Arabinose-binding domain of AraC transcription regulator, N-term
MMADRLRISSTWGERFADQEIAVPTLLRRAGLPAGLFEQEKVYVTTSELFALWRSVAEMSSDPGVGLKLGAENTTGAFPPRGHRCYVQPDIWGCPAATRPLQTTHVSGRDSHSQQSAGNRSRILLRGTKGTSARCAGFRPIGGIHPHAFTQSPFFSSLDA